MKSAEIKVLRYSVVGETPSSLTCPSLICPSFEVSAESTNPEKKQNYFKNRFFELRNGAALVERTLDVIDRMPQLL